MLPWRRTHKGLVKAETGVIRGRKRDSKAALWPSEPLARLLPCFTGKVHGKKNKTLPFQLVFKYSQLFCNKYESWFITTGPQANLQVYLTLI